MFLLSNGFVLRLSQKYPYRYLVAGIAVVVSVVVSDECELHASVKAIAAITKIRMKLFFSILFLFLLKNF
jgi:hypothetical protein